MFCNQLRSFQFHKGTIETKRAERREKMKAKFQFHKGTIETLGARKIISMRRTFQFHKGTIETLMRFLRLK